MRERCRKISSIFNDIIIELSKGVSEIEKQQIVVNNLNKEQQIIESAMRSLVTNLKRDSL